VYKITPARADPAVRFARAKLIKARHEALTKEGKGRPPFYIFADESWAWARSYKKGRFCDRGDTKRPSAPRKTSFLPKVNTFGMLTEKSLRTYDVPPSKEGKSGVKFADFFKLLKATVPPLLKTWRPWPWQKTGRAVVLRARSRAAGDAAVQPGPESN
jgi:hypothetical protein